MNDPHDNALDDKAILEKLTAMSAETESILRENAETRADLGLDVAEEDLSDEALETGPTIGGESAMDGAWRRESTAAGDLVDSETGEVLQDAPGWDPSTRTILNNEGCDWAGGRLREKREALDECHRMYDAEVKRIQEQCDRLMAAAEARLAKATAPLHRDADFLENVIRAYAETHRAEVLRGLRKGSKSRTFPSGLKVAWKSGGGEYRWRKDMKPAEREAALLPWASGRRGCTRSVEVVDLAEVKKYLAWAREEAKNNSEAPPTPPGLEYVPEHEELTVKVEE